ncbi:NADH:ubiquinone oxidoreductase 20.1kD subunit [Apodospora peruviana]|uniref:NADH:ubiquinone oxidoreductase 20.1kD subunit n=1 Tax=Apodospora peruviana TaxID=516989 RepID=A0AAE0ICW0_9PEZI|nr:NADH:ubiquinone oxidoreductase 20.1kD subunit [Apodospora peruviana]
MPTYGQLLTDLNLPGPRSIVIVNHLNCSIVVGIAAPTIAKMLSRRIARASQLRMAARRLPVVQHRTFMPEQVTGRKEIDEQYPDFPTLSEAEDPGQNGGYINPPRIKRQFRDPHSDWWDKQERRNYGEPVHEDNDILGMFSPYEYTWVSPAKGLFQIGCFVATVLGLCFVIKQTYPDQVSYPREFEGGLVKELGGAGALRARKAGDADP